MPSSKPEERFADIVENIDPILTYTHGYDFQKFSTDTLCQDAVERCLLRITEAAAKLKGIADSPIPGMPWDDIRSLGNVIRHEYDSVDLKAIWSIVENDLASLKSAILDRWPGLS